MGRIADFFSRRRQRKLLRKGDGGVSTLPPLPPDEEAQLFLEREAVFAPAPDPFARAVTDVAFDEVEGISHEFEEDTTVDELYAHHIRQKFFRRRDTTRKGRLVTATILGPLRDGTIAWVGDDSSAYGQCDISVFGREQVGLGDEVRARIISHPWGHTIEVVDHQTYLTAEEVHTKHERQLGGLTAERTPAPELVKGTWRETLEPGDVVFTHVPFGDSYGYRPGGAIAKNRPAAFVRWEHDYAVVRPIYGTDTHVARNGLGTELLERGCLSKDSVIRKVAFDIHPDCLLKKLGRLGDKDLVALNFLDGLASQGAAVPAKAKKKEKRAEESGNIPEDDQVPVIFAAAVEPWKQTVREIVLYMCALTSHTDPDAILSEMIVSFCGVPDVADVMVTEGLSYAHLGQALNMVCQPRQIDTKGRNFTQRTADIVERLRADHGLPLVARQSEHGTWSLFIQSGSLY